MKKITAFLLTFCLILQILSGMILQADAVVIETIAGLKAFGAVCSIGSTALKWRKSALFAISQNDDSHSFMEWFSAYNYGNAAVYKVENLTAMMQDQFEAVNSGIANLSSQLDEVQDTLDNISKQISQVSVQIITADDRNRLNEFILFYKENLEYLNLAYNNVAYSLADSHDDSIEAAFAQLYRRTESMNAFAGYLSGEYDVESRSIFDIYYDYLQYRNAEDIVEETTAFILTLYSTFLYVQYCQTLCYVYQQGIMERDKKDAYSYGDIIWNKKAYKNDLIPLVNQKYNSVTEKALTLLTSLYELGTSFGYSPVDDGRVYSVRAEETAYAYPDSLLYFRQLPYNVIDCFGDDFSFNLTNESDCQVQIDQNGVAALGHETNNTDSVFTVSLTFQDITLYEYTLTFRPGILGGGYGQESAPYLIKDSAQFEEFLNNSEYHADGVSVYLDTDIDAETCNIVEVANYYGHFDGGNHTISKIGEKYLLEVNHGTIENLYLSDISRTVNHRPGATSYYKNPIYSYGFCMTNEGRLFNVHLSGMKMTDSLLCAFDPLDYRGGLCAVNNGTICYCSVSDIDISYDGAFDVCYQDVTSNIGIGGLCGYNTGNVHHVSASGVRISMSVNVKCDHNCTFLVIGAEGAHTTNGWLGGLIGRNSGSLDTYSSVDFSAGTPSVTGSSRCNASGFGHNSNYVQKNSKSIQTSAACGGNGATNKTDNAAAYSVGRILVKATPLCSLYGAGEPFNPAGLVVWAEDSVGEFSPVYGYSLENTTTSDIGIYNALVRLYGLTAGFEYEVAQIECSHIMNKTEQIAPTCTQKGRKVFYTCFDCKKMFADPNGTAEITSLSALDIPAVGHTIVTVEGTSASCTTPGNTAYWLCPGCGTLFADADAQTEITADSVAIPATGHIWDKGVITTLPTTTTEGVKTFTCEVCHETKTESVPVSEEIPADAPQYVVNSNEAAIGHAFTLTVSIANNPGIITEKLTVNYDMDVFELVSVTDGQLLNGFVTPSPKLTSPYTLFWKDSLATANNTANGTIAKLTLRVKDTAAVGYHTISIEHAEARSITGSLITLYGASAAVSVTDNVRTGDLDGDGAVTDWDSVLMDRYLAGWEVDIEEAAADIDGDGAVTDWDGVIFDRYLAGWDVECAIMD